jgi:hypothetical protein
MPGRNARQCRERWKHYVSVGCVTRPWTKAEDALLIEKEQEHGPHWTTLTQFFQRRSDVQIKTRWLKLMHCMMQRHSAPCVVQPTPPPQADDQITLVFDENPTLDDDNLDFEWRFDGSPTDALSWF